MRLRKVLPLAMGVGAVAAAVVGYSLPARSADHLDSPSVLADPSIDITDVYSWMDTTHVVLALNVFPVAMTTSQFSNVAQYVIHTGSSATFGATTHPVDIIATFDNSATQNIQLWVGTTEYLTGNANVPAGLTSADGKVTVFAGPRADPFFFNLDGFHNVQATVKSVIAGGTLTLDPAGCPNNLTPAQSQLLISQLSTAPDGGTAVDFFKTLNVLSIVVKVDKTLLTGGGALVAVSGATYK